MIPRANSPILLILQFYLILSTYSFADDDIDCDSLVEREFCWTQPGYMREHCEKECADWQVKQETHNSFPIDDENDSFYDLSAKNGAGEKINFEQFEGYVTIIVNMIKRCDGELKDIEAYLSFLEQIRNISPYAIEVLAFPFEHSKMDYATKDCTLFEQAAAKPGRPIHIMEQAKINGPDAHPVYRFLKRTAGMDDIKNDIPTFFIVGTEGNKLDVHQGSTLRTFMEHLRLRLSTDYREEL